MSTTKTTKAIALVDNMDNMLQRQIKALGSRIDIEDPEYRKCDAITSFHSIGCMLRSVNVTIYRTFHPRRKTKFSDKTGT